MALPKVLVFSRNGAEARALLPLARLLYYSGAVEGMAVIATAEEWAREDNPLIHRFYEEFSLEPPRPEDPEWLLKAVQRALLEEQAEAAVFPNTLPPFDRALESCRPLLRTLVWPDETLRTDRHLRPAPDAVGVLTPQEAETCEVPALTSQERLLEWLSTPPPPAPRVQVALRPADLARPHLQALADRLPEGRCLVLGQLAREVQALRPGCHAEDDGGDYAAVVDLLASATHADPEAVIRQARERAAVRSLHLVPVNLSLGGATFRYGDYDNEYARGPASHDLQQLLPGPRRARVLDARGGGRPLWQAPIPHPEAPDGAVPMFLVQAERAPLPPEDWLEPFRLPEGERLHVVFVDTQNIAGSVLNHAVAVNRHTPHRALALCRTRHPYIGYPQEESRAVFVDEQAMDPKLHEELERADCFVFFEDDDETTPVGPLDLRPFVKGKRVVHLYIGQRVHRDVARHQRPGRRVLTPLPHLLRMFPEARFYAGFPPATLEEVPLRPPRSQRDGIVRLLHTPSLPHPTLSRFYYHKDTESFLEAVRKVGRRSGTPVEPWQVAGWPHHEVMEARLDCDATFNQLRGYHGLSGDEAMFLGRPVIQAFDQFNTNRHREYWGLDVEFPWISTTPDRLADVLVELVESPERREALGRKCRQFMLDYFSPQAGILPLLWYCARAPRT